MTDLAYLIWLVATALMTVTILAVGTLAAADLLPRRRRSGDIAVARQSGVPPSASPPTRAGTPGRHDRAA